MVGLQNGRVLLGRDRDGFLCFLGWRPACCTPWATGGHFFQIPLPTEWAGRFNVTSGPDVHWETRAS